MKTKKQTKQNKNTDIRLRKELPYSAKSRTARKGGLAKILVRAIKSANAGQVNLQTKNRAIANPRTRAV